MSGVDNRIVTMQFNNREFEQNAKTSMSTLARLRESLDFGKITGGAIRSLGAVSNVLGKVGVKNPFATSIQGASDLQRAAQVAGGSQGMGVLEGGVTAVSSKFIALSTIAITALSNITNRAINAGTTFAKSFTVGPLVDGLHEYETTLKSIQTVQANTDQPLPKIEKALQALNDYSDTTIYNFGEMAKNVGTFTAAGVNLEDSVASIRGIANVAALSGSSSEQAAGAMYQLSQAIAAGKVGAQDWNSVVNAGMAGKKLQTALAQTAVAMGVLNKAAVTTNKTTGALQINSESFKNSIMAKPGEESWLSSGVLVNTLATLDGRFSKVYQQQLLNEDGTRRFTDAQIKSNMALARANLEKKNGVKFSEQQYKDLLKMASASTAAAQDVKTLGQVFDIAKETIGSGWAASFKNVFGNLKESKKLFTGMSNGLNELIRNNSIARNEMLAVWKKNGGRQNLIDALTNSWTALRKVLGPVMDGMRDIFPKKKALDLMVLTKAFEDFTKSLIPSKKTMENLRDISGGVFAVLSIGRTIVKGAVEMFKSLFTTLGGGNGDFLNFAAGIGRSVKEFDEFLKKSGVVTSFFESLGKILAVPLSILKGVGGLISALFGGFDSGAANDMKNAIGDVGDKLGGLERIAGTFGKFFEGLGDLFSNVGATIGKAIVKIGDVVADMFTPETFSQTLDVVNTSLLGALVLMIRKFLSGGVNVDLSGGLFDGIKETLGSATSAFQTMQQNLKANVLIKLAAAIAVMALALLVLSGIDPKALTKSLAAMSGGFAVLIGAMATLLKVMGPAGLVQLYVVTSAMTKMALSILLLSFALKTMAGIKFGDMLRGLTGLSATMFILTKTMKPLAASSSGMAKASYSLILVGIALNILAVALKIFATMSWEEMGKGLAGLTSTLLALAVGLKLMPPMQSSALGLIAVGLALNMIAVAMKVFATMSWEEMAKGVVSIAGALLAISLAINTMPKTMILQAAALVLVAGALVVLSGVLKVMGSMGWESIAKGLVTLAGSLVIIGLALKLMGPTAILGAAALVVVAAGLNALLPVLVAFAAMKWSTLLKSLAGLAAVFIVIGVAGYLLTPVIGTILALGLALTLMGAGLALMGAGALLFSTAFAMVVAAGAAGIQILTGLLAAVIAAIPPAIAALAAGVVQFAVLIAQAQPQIAAAFSSLIGALLDGVINNVPKIGQAFQAIVNEVVRILTVSIPRLATAGYKMIVGLLTALSKNIPRIADKGSDVIEELIKGIGRNSGDIIDAAYQAIIDFMEGLTTAIDENSAEFGEKAADLGIAIVEGVVKGLAGAGGAIKDKLIELGKDAWNGIKDFFGIGSPSKLMEDSVGVRLPQGMANGIGKGVPEVVGELNALGKTAMSTMSEAMKGVNDAFMLDSNLNQPTISPVLDLSGVSREASKMSNILTNAPVMATVSYESASDISAMTQTSNGGGGEPGDPSTQGGGGTNIDLTLELHSPKAIDTVDAYRTGKTLISLAKEALS